MGEGSCSSYPKIETLFNRDEHHHVDTNSLRCPEFGLIKSWLVTEKIDGTNIRVSLEADPKLYNLSQEVDLQHWHLRFYGRTDKAQVPTFLLTYLQDTFTLDKMQNLWRGKPNCPKCGGSGQYDSGEPKPLTRNYPGHRDYQCDCVEPYPIALYGEGYGERIQKGGGNYREGVSFRLIDVLVDGRWWLDWEGVCDVAAKLGINTVPMIQDGVDLAWVTSAVQNGVIASKVAKEDRNLAVSPIGAEGVVARTDPYLYDKHSHPLRFKLKTKDFADAG